MFLSTLFYIKIRFKRIQRYNKKTTLSGGKFSSGLVHPLACRLSLLLTLNAGFLVSLFLAEVADNAVPGTLAFKTSERAVQRLVFTNSNGRHILASFSLRDLFLAIALIL